MGQLVSPGSEFLGPAICTYSYTAGHEGMSSLSRKGYRENNYSALNVPLNVPQRKLRPGLIRMEFIMRKSRIFP